MAQFDPFLGDGSTVGLSNVSNASNGLYTGSGGTYTAPNNSGVNYGLNYSTQTGYTPNLYPGYVSPPSGVGEQVTMPDYQPYALPSWQQTTAVSPTYQGMMGGDYDAWQKALTTPGEIASKTAYDQGYTKLNNQMGGQGLYGSSIMANQARTALDTPYQQALATNAANAAATRYGMQQTDVNNQNTFAQNAYGQALGYNEAQNNFAANLAGTGVNQAMNQYNAAYNKANAMQNYNNLAAGSSEDYNQYLYNLAAMGYGNTQQLTQLGLLGNANAVSQAQSNFNATNATNSTNGWLGAAGTVAGGLLTKGSNNQTNLGNAIDWGVNAYNNWGT